MVDMLVLRILEQDSVGGNKQQQGGTGGNPSAMAAVIGKGPVIMKRAQQADMTVEDY